MAKTNLTKYIVFQVLIVALTAAASAFPDALLIIAALTVQAGLYTYVALQRPFWASLAAPAASYLTAFAMIGSPIFALVAVMFFPMGAVFALCINKGASRARTVLWGAVSLGVSAVLITVLYYAVNGGFSLSLLSEKLVAGFGFAADLMVAQVPEAYFTQGLAGVTEEAYRRLLFGSMRMFFLGFVALLCAASSFFATAMAKRLLLSSEDCPYFKRDKEWLYVLPKPSAAAFLICYLCEVVGGDTLTLPQQIAFNTVVVALLGGVLVMSARVLKRRIGIMGISSVLIYVVIYFIFGVQAVLVIMSVTGLIAAFSYKPQEDKEVCKK